MERGKGALRVPATLLHKLLRPQACNEPCCAQPTVSCAGAVPSSRLHHSGSWRCCASGMAGSRCGIATIAGTPAGNDGPKDVVRADLIGIARRTVGT